MPGDRIGVGDAIVIVFGTIFNAYHQALWIERAVNALFPGTLPL